MTARLSTRLALWRAGAFFGILAAFAAVVLYRLDCGRPVFISLKHGVLVRWPRRSVVSVRSRVRSLPIACGRLLHVSRHQGNTCNPPFHS